MLYGIILIIAGLLCILLPKTNWYRESIIKHNHLEVEELLSSIRNIVGFIFIFLGVLSFFS
ncbi:hypothetical protein ACQPUY_04790 [Clostridium nigeriense]|uniref:hypothetical protein n=1 Tax=Clostridium nigeriense TaxID=1805470 RepID=UPI003D33846C